jgi:hypothetical protein
MSAFSDLYWTQIGSKRDTPTTQILKAASTRSTSVFDDEPIPATSGLADETIARIDSAPPGELNVDRFMMKDKPWPYGREALREAVFVCAWEIHHHAMAVWRPKVHEHVDTLLANAVATIAEIRKFENLFGLTELGEVAGRFERLAGERIRQNSAVEKESGRPNNDHLRAIAEAVARVWADREGRVIPRAGTKGPHPLNDLLDAVSLDLFDRAKILTTNNLRVKPGEKPREPRTFRTEP